MQNKVQSPITGGVCEFYCLKEGVNYYRCLDTKTIFTPDVLNQADMVGGTNELDRNFGGNHARISRIQNILPVVTVLDYGCGNGMFLETMLSRGLIAEGYDPYSEKYKKKPKRFYDVITMIEVIEHTRSPFDELRHVHSLLRPGGLLYIETSFSDWVNKDHPYLNPRIGHCTVFSQIGLDMVMMQRGFQYLNPIDNNTRLYTK